MPLSSSLGRSARRPNLYGSQGGGLASRPLGAAGGGLSTSRPLGMPSPLLGGPSRSALTGLPRVQPRFGIPLGAQSAAARFAEMAAASERPKGFLSIVGQVLNAPIAGVAGFVRGFLDSQEDAQKSPYSPLQIFHALGAGFQEIPEAVGETYTMGDLIRDRTDRKSFLYKHSGIIGLTMDVVLDPTTYLSFGATSASKIAARRLWSQTWDESFAEARALIAEGKQMQVNGVSVNAADLGHTKVAFLQHHDARRPWTLGDSLSALHRSGEIATQAARQGEYGKLAQARSYMLPSTPLGGQGIRFAGKEIPGTPEVSAWLANRLQSKVTKLVSRGQKGPVNIEELLRYNGGDLIPDETVDLVMGDVVRTLAKTDMRQFIEASFKSTELQFKNELRALDDASIEVARGIQNLGDLRTRQLATPEIMLGRVAGVKGTPFEQANQVRKIKSTIEGERKKLTSQAVNAGVSESTLGKWWDDAITRPQYKGDPAMALYEYHWRVKSDLVKKDFLDRVLDNPIFATKIRKGTDYSAFSTNLDKVFLPPGMEKIHHRGSDYAIRREIYDATQKLRNPAVMDEDLNKFLKTAGYLQNIWKIPATIMNPSFHTMNFVGGIWNNLLAGITNPVDYVKAAGLLYKSAADQRAVLEEGAAPTARMAEREALEHGAGGMSRSGPIQGDIEGQMAAINELRRGENTGFRAGVPLLTKAGRARRPVESAPRYAARQAAQLTGVPALVGLGRTTGGKIEQLLRTTPAHKYATDRRLMHYFDEFSHGYIPDGAPLHWGPERTKAMYDIGGLMSRRFQFDYADLHPVERYLKQVFPFWVYHKNNTILQSAELLKQPGKVATAQKVFNYLQEEVAGGGGGLDDFAAFLPNYFENLGAFEIPVPDWLRDTLGLEKDQPVFLNPKLPFHSAFAMYPPLWDLFRDTDENVYDKVGRIFSGIGGAWGPVSAAPIPIPGAKLMIEAWTNRSFGLGRPIDFQRASSNDWRKSYVDAPGYMAFVPDAIKGHLGIFQSPETGKDRMSNTAAYIANALVTPFVSNAGKAVGTNAEFDGKAAGDLISWMTGLRLMPVDMLKLTRAWGYQTENMLEGRRAELKQRGADLPPEEMGLLREVRAQLKVIEVYHDARVAEE